MKPESSSSISLTSLPSVGFAVLAGFIDSQISFYIYVLPLFFFGLRCFFKALPASASDSLSLMRPSSSYCFRFSEKINEKTHFKGALVGAILDFRFVGKFYLLLCFLGFLSEPANFSGTKSTLSKTVFVLDLYSFLLFSRARCFSSISRILASSLAFLFC